jgi:hypothetical protein
VTERFVLVDMLELVIMLWYAVIRVVAVGMSVVGLSHNRLSSTCHYVGHA